MAEKEKIQKVPEGWEVKVIDNLCEILDSKRVPISDENRQLMKGDIPYYGANGVVDYINKFIFNEDLILLAEDGGHFEEWMTKPIAYRVSGKSWVNNHAHVLKNKDGVSLGFVFCNLEHRNITYYISGGTRGKLNQSQLRSMPVLIPQSLIEQTRIASILSTCDEAIEKTDAKIEKLKRIKQGLMQDLFRFGIDENGKMRSEATHRFKDASLGRIPEEWDVKTLEDVVNYIGSGVTPTGGEAVYQKEGIKFVRSQNVTFKGIFEEDIAYINESIHKRMQRSEIYSFDILLNITGASIGRCCVVPEYFGKANVNQHVCAIRLLERDLCLSSFVSYFLQSHLGQKQIDILNAGGNREGLNYQQIRSFHIYRPTKPEQSRIASILSSADEAIEKEEAYKNKLLAIKRGLMDDLLSGKVRVNKLTKEAA